VRCALRVWIAPEYLARTGRARRSRLSISPRRPALRSSSPEDDATVTRRYVPSRQGRPEPLRRPPRGSGTKCLATARVGAPSRLGASPASQRRHGRCFESARLASGCGRPTNSPRTSRQRIELIPWSSPTGPCNLLMHDWAEGPIVREFSLSADWDDRWRTGGTIGEVIDEAHLAPEHILLAIKRFVAERSRRLEAMHATLDAADRR
jgi:hypothetical protein